MAPVRKRKTEKRCIKFLSECRNPKIINQIIKDCQPGIIKSICNAALNAEIGDVTLTSHQKRIFSQNRNLFTELTNPQTSIDKKRKIILQRGSGFGFIIPILLSTVLSALGSSFIRQ